MLGPQTSYEPSFYHYVEGEAARSAGPVAELVLNWFEVESVVDVGCGTGAWLDAFTTRGVTDILGLDHGAVPRETLQIPTTSFMDVDLAEPPDLGRTFDLALCLEVAEHLAEPSAAELVVFLTSLAPVVVFSAAIPGQGGVGHINEQWPAYWSERFDAAGYACLDVLRPMLWGDQRVAPFYRQNLMLFVERNDGRAMPDSLGGGSLPVPPLPLVHPEILALLMAQRRRPPAPPSVRALLRDLPRAVTDAARRRTRSALRRP